MPPDIDYHRGTVMIRQGRGRKDRMLPIGERALAWIARYVGEVRPHLVLHAGKHLGNEGGPHGGASAMLAQSTDLAALTENEPIDTAAELLAVLDDAAQLE